MIRIATIAACALILASCNQGASESTPSDFDSGNATDAAAPTQYTPPDEEDATVVKSPPNASEGAK